MKPVNYFIVFMLAGALTASAGAQATAASAGKGKGHQRGGVAAEHMSTKGAANTNAQWSADPERGWVRASERHELHQKGGSQTKTSETKGKQKGKDKGKKF
jgi:hypothetical protein